MPPRAALLVAVGSSNPVKVAAAAAVVRHVDPGAIVRGVEVPSGVPDQPWGDEETIQGATARARAARRSLDADLGIGIEGGVVDSPDGQLRTCAWAVAELRDGRTFLGGSLAMPLPPPVARLVRDGVELGVAMDRISGGLDTKRGAGAVGILTDGAIDRQRAYEILVTYALAPLLAPAFWDPSPPGATP